MSDQEQLPQPRVNLRFVHAFCDDVPATKAFYGDRLGMTLQSTMDDEPHGWVVMQSEGFQLMFHRWDHGPLQRSHEWSWQPGDGAGELPTISFGIEVPEDDYRAVVDGLMAADTEAITPTPTWRQGCYWGWTVRDPNGNTVEIYTMPAEEIDDDEPVWKPTGE